MKENMKNYWKKNGFYVVLTVALVVVLCISGVAGYRSGMKDKLAAENAAQFREAENVPEVFGESIEETTATGAKTGESETKAGETAEKPRKPMLPWRKHLARKRKWYGRWKATF